MSGPHSSLTATKQPAAHAAVTRDPLLSGALTRVTLALAVVLLLGAGYILIR